MIDFIQEIYGTIKRNKLRTALTGFAVAWGIFMLIVLLGAGNGVLNAFEQGSGNMAMNSFQIWPGRTSMAYQGLKEGRNIKLTEKELAMLPLCCSKAFSRPFPAPSRTMSIKMPHATANPVSAVRSLLRLMVPNISCTMSIMAVLYFMSPLMPKGEAAWSLFSSIRSMMPSLMWIILSV